MSSQSVSRVGRHWRPEGDVPRRLLALAALALAVGCGRAGVSPGAREEAEGRDQARPAVSDVLVVEPAAQEQIQLRVEMAEVRTIAETMRTTGVIAPNETRVARLRPLARGVIERLYVRRGDRVRPGQPLAAYDNIELGELLAEYRTAGAGLEKASAEVEVTRRALERGKNLLELGALATAEYERRRAEDASASAGVKVEQARLANVQQKLRRFGVTDTALAHGAAGSESGGSASRAVLRAPFGGTVISTNVAEGEVVDPEREVLTIANLSTVWIQGDVYEKDLAAVSEGQPAKVFVDAYPGETFIGSVTYVSDVLEPATRTAKVRCEVRNPQGRLKLEMFATVEIPTSRARKSVAIPATAVQKLDDETIVFVKVDDRRFRKRAVRVGVETDGWVEVLQGLQAGEPVVTQGAVMLKSKLTIGEFAERE